MRVGERVWKAAPLPQAFTAALESGNWLRALQMYQRHPYHTPPADTFDLLKAIMYYTGVGIEDVKERFNEKMRITSIAQRRRVDEVEWSVFWEAVDRGDGKTICDAISGSVCALQGAQIGVAELCAVLLKGAGEDWQTQLVDDMPFSTVSRHNLIHAALTQRRPDVATEMLSHFRISRSEAAVLWPLMSKCTWEEVLGMISMCPKASVPYNAALPFILRSGCSLQRLSEHLEQARVLGDSEVVAPLLGYAVETEDWSYVERCVGHLVDIGKITASARDAFSNLCRLHGPKRVCLRLLEHQVELSSMTMKDLESLRL
ncbi:hypothetical protein NESM_000462400 [Novymonas esmeraldas]|uniref:Uncharacterized protein n=1 Tax=Novymonas esmeraldas TaxID=1808958 RepID=A0AAW0EQ28_9TRYP